MSDLYEADILAWSEQQTDLLRRHAAGELSNDGALDWPNILEELESVGREQLHAVESFLVQALVHDLKAEGWPLLRDVPNWRADAIGFRGDAASRFTASMRQRIDLKRLYERALRRLPETMDGQPPLPLPSECPMTLDELLADDP